MTTGLWRHPQFLKLWTGQTISVIGDQASPVLRPIVLNAATFTLAVNMVLALYVLYATRALGLAPEVLGLPLASCV